MDDWLMALAYLVGVGFAALAFSFLGAIIMMLYEGRWPRS
jgi:hypothetical protein